jgi:hypothetical protein
MSTNLGGGPGLSGPPVVFLLTVEKEHDPHKSSPSTRRFSKVTPSYSDFLGDNFNHGFSFWISLSNELMEFKLFIFLPKLENDGMKILEEEDCS